LEKVRPYYDDIGAVVGFVMDRVDFDDPVEDVSANTPDVPAAPVVEPAPEGKVVVKPGHEGWYGKIIRALTSHGLFKPWDYEHPASPGASRLWLLLASVQPTDIKTVGLYKADGTWVRWCNWPNGIGPLSGLPIDGRQITADPSHPFGWRSSAPPKGSGIDHAGRVKIRNAKPSREEWAAGACVLKVIDGFGQVVHVMHIENPDIRHEGKLK